MSIALFFGGKRERDNVSVADLAFSPAHACGRCEDAQERVNDALSKFNEVPETTPVPTLGDLGDDECCVAKAARQSSEWTRFLVNTGKLTPKPPLKRRALVRSVAFNKRPPSLDDITL